MCSVGKAEWGTLLQRLMTHGPLAYQAIGLLRSATRGLVHPEITVDQWPDFTSVAMTLAADEDEIFEMGDRSKYLYTTDVTAGSQLLLKNEASWSRNFLFSGIPSNVGDIAEQLVKRLELRYRRTGPYLLMEATAESVPSLARCRPPKGYQLADLEHQDAYLIADTWEYKGYYDRLEPSLCALMDSFPSVGVRTVPAGDLVGWMLQRHNGPLGILYVMPAHRRRGLAKTIVSNLCHKVLGNNESAVYLNLDPKNTASLKLHDSCGFRIIPGGDCDWMYVESKNM